MKNVYGEPVVVGDRTVIPVAQVRFGFGGGGGSREGAENSGGGGGGGMKAQPAGALEITPQATRFIVFEDRKQMAAALALGFMLGVAVAALARQK